MPTKEIKIGSARACRKFAGSGLALDSCNRREKMFNACAEFLRDFNISWVVVDQDAGYLYSNASTSFFQLLQYGEIDTYNGLFHITSERFQLYQISPPVAYSLVTAYVQNQPILPEERVLGFVLQPFEPTTWLLASACVAFLLLLNIRSPNGFKKALGSMLIAMLFMIYSAELKAHTTTSPAGQLPSTIESMTKLIAQRKVTLVTQNPTSSIFEQINASQAENLRALRDALELNPVIRVASVAAACQLVMSNNTAMRYVYIEGSLTVVDNPECARLMCGMISVPLEGLAGTAWTVALFRKNIIRNSRNFLLDRIRRCAQSSIPGRTYHRNLLRVDSSQCYVLESDPRSSKSSLPTQSENELISLQQLKDAFLLLTFCYLAIALVFAVERVRNVMVAFFTKVCCVNKVSGHGKYCVTSSTS